MTTYMFSNWLTVNESLALYKEFIKADFDLGKHENFLDYISEKAKLCLVYEKDGKYWIDVFPFEVCIQKKGVCHRLVGWRLMLEQPNTIHEILHMIF